VNDKWESAIWIMDADGGRNRFLVKGGGPVWSPDGNRIAYVAAAEEPKGAQIFVRWMDSEGATSQITRLAEGPGSLRWSPDGKWIGFVMFVPKSDDWAIDMPSAPANGKWTAPPRVVNRLHYRLDRSGYTRTGFSHIFVVPADGGSARELTTGEWSVGAPFDALTFGAAWDWMPDGKTIVTDGFGENDGDMNYRDSNIYAIDVATGARKRLTPERGRWSGPVVSPDGSKIAFAGHTFTKQTYHTQDMMLMNPDGSGVKNISGGMDRDPGFTPPIWAPDGSGLFLAPEDKGSRNVVFLPVDGSGPKSVTTGAQVISLGGITRTGVLVGTRATFTSPEDVVKITRTKSGADVVQLTNINEDLLAGKKLATAEEIWYTSSGGQRCRDGS
jgi:Tol biopolymer transport system component